MCGAKFVSCVRHPFLSPFPGWLIRPRLPTAYAVGGIMAPLRGWAAEPRQFVFIVEIGGLLCSTYAGFRGARH